MNQFLTFVWPGRIHFLIFLYIRRHDNFLTLYPSGIFKKLTFLYPSTIFKKISGISECNPTVPANMVLELRFFREPYNCSDITFRLDLSPNTVANQESEKIPKSKTPNFFREFIPKLVQVWNAKPSTGHFISICRVS